MGPLLDTKKSFALQWKLQRCKSLVIFNGVLFCISESEKVVSLRLVYKLVQCDGQVAIAVAEVPRHSGLQVALVGKDSVGGKTKGGSTATLRAGTKKRKITSGM